MQVTALEIADVKLLSPKKHGDARGFFSEIYSRREFKRMGIELDFVQDNHSMSAQKGVLRGLHYQLAPMAQDKLVRVVRGAILDVAVDIRKSSASFGRHVSAILSADNWRQMLIPIGFAHGFVTLEPNTEVLYKVSNYYSPENERGIAWNDPDLSIAWGIDPTQAILSERDKIHPLLKNAAELFD
ncbi:MAG TPA: dTDP-4-dehydrorhamnose 3,5-epimerase [Tepidisphaeraceae bacterium]|nr:dTDP-4-dehydrorhamnose 3,5-epimerase [Tepidisphaeraceae bacterium]